MYLSTVFNKSSSSSRFFFSSAQASLAAWHSASLFPMLVEATFMASLAASYLAFWTSKLAFLAFKVAFPSAKAEVT